MDDFHHIEDTEIDMKKKNPTVTVALSALNEEQNIENFIQSVLKQKQVGFVLKKILIISDGSTDNTARKVRSFKNSIIEVREFKKRKGKAARLNQIHTLVDTDILIENDADVVYANDLVIRDIVAAFQKNPHVMMCGGNIEPYHPDSFLEKAILDSLEVYQRMSSKLRRGENVYTAQGRLLAYRKEFIKKITIPNTIGTDVFAYLNCKQLGYTYKFVRSARVYFKFPTTVKDHIRQNTRYIRTGNHLKRYFPKELLEKEGYIPRGLFLKEMFRQFIRHPVTSSFIFLINKYCSLRAKYLNNSITGKWDISVTSKLL